MYQSSLLFQFDWLTHGVSERSDDDMRLGNSSGGAVEENRIKFFERLDITPREVVSAGLVHGTRIASVTYNDEKLIPRTDGLLTAKRGLGLAVTAADCLPIFFVDAHLHIVGVAHVGWRGTIYGVQLAVVAAMENFYGVKPSDLVVAVGPSIGQCHFEMRAPEAERFRREFPQAVIVREGRVMVDLRRVNRDLLIRRGVKAENIDASPPCTFCDERFFSFRRDKPPRIEAMVAVIALR